MTYHTKNVEGEAGVEAATSRGSDTTAPSPSTPSPQEAQDGPGSGSESRGTAQGAGQERGRTSQPESMGAGDEMPLPVPAPIASPQEAAGLRLRVLVRRVLDVATIDGHYCITWLAEGDAMGYRRWRWWALRDWRWFR
jgi:hypothetical protein